jgi:hypothetical protein
MGAPGYSLLVLQDGEAAVTRAGQIAKLELGDFFGEIALLTDTSTRRL